MPQGVFLSPSVPWEGETSLLPEKAQDTEFMVEILFPCSSLGYVQLFTIKDGQSPTFMTQIPLACAGRETF